MSGVVGRLHLAARLSFPAEEVQKAFAKLATIFLALELERAILRRAISRVAARYKASFNRRFLEYLLRAVQSRDFLTLLRMSGREENFYTMFIPTPF
jgi:hypothetical protein